MIFIVVPLGFVLFLLVAVIVMNPLPSAAVIVILVGIWMCRIANQMGKRAEERRR